MKSLHRTPLTAAGAALAAQLLSSTAFAHIELQSPLNRYSDIKIGDNKACPCGSGSTNRSCKKPEEWSDEDRSTDRATTFAPGATVTVRFDEYVGHSGRYRIAFDPDGADLNDFNDHILLDEPDPSGNVGNMGQGSMWEFQVTLPMMTCENCTLQLIQVMDGNTTDKVLNPADRGGTYFQCADIVLADGAPLAGLAPDAPTDHPGAKGRPNTTPATTGSSDMMTGTATTGMMTGTPAVNTMTSVASGTGAMTTTTPVATPMDSASEDEGGCSLGGGVRTRGVGQALGALSLVGVALGLRARRRRR